MARFASPARQAANVIKRLQGTVIRSVGTARNFEQAYRRISQFLSEHGLGSLQDLSIPGAIDYLQYRSQHVKQSTLNMERQAIQTLMKNISHHLGMDQRLPTIRSQLRTDLNSRAYTDEQVQMIASAQSDKNALGTQIAHAAGLRAHELYTLRRSSERPADLRPQTVHKFCGREGVRYTVHGKGGLIREVMLPSYLSNRLEVVRLSTPEVVIDRNIRIEFHYHLGGGQRWSSSFSKASQRVLGWTEGAHGVRHAYAQQRMEELQSSGLEREPALETVSQELGHFRANITEIYLR